MFIIDDFLNAWRGLRSSPKFLLLSSLVLALWNCTCNPSAPEARSMSARINAEFVTLVGFTTTAIRAAAGTSSRNSPSRFAVTSAAK